MRLNVIYHFHIHLVFSILFNFTILDRWGNQITQLNAIDQSWNGKSDGKECTTGIYFYSATVEFTSGEIANYHGFIDLIR
jgi:gliding motility-associated-like protein